MKRQYPNRSHRATNRLRTRRRQLCIKWRIDARGMSFHIRWTSKRKSATLRTMVLGLFDNRLMQHFTFSIKFKSEFLHGHAIQNSHGARRNRSLAFPVCDVHGPIVHEHGWFCGGWLSRCGTVWVSRTSLKYLGVGGAVRFLVVGTIGQGERPPRGQHWMEQCLTSLKYWPI